VARKRAFQVKPPGLSESLGRRVTGGDLRDHRHGRVDLRPTLERIIGAGVSPPIPASQWIGRGRRGLRIKDHDVVRVGPLIDAGFLHELLLDYALILQAAVEYDV
jgi:hypothetical protein